MKTSNSVSIRFHMMSPSGTMGRRVLDDTRLQKFLETTAQIEGSSPPFHDAVLSFFPGHDSSIAVIENGVVLATLELERLFNIRYMAGWGTGSVGSPLKEPPTEIWKKATEAILKFCDLSGKTFKFGAIVPLDFGEVHNAAVSAIKLVAPVNRWVIVDHHLSHANLVLHDLPWDNKVRKRMNARRRGEIQFELNTV